MNMFNVHIYDDSQIWMIKKIFIVAQQKSDGNTKAKEVYVFQLSPTDHIGCLCSSNVFELQASV